MGAWDSWSKEVDSRGAELPEQPPHVPLLLGALLQF